MKKMSWCWILFAMVNTTIQLWAQSDNMQNLKLFLGGDVMLGRGIDQAFSSSVDPTLYEPYVKNARSYIELAERENGAIPDPISYKYIWKEALRIWKEENPDLKLINLETSITTKDVPWPNKGIHYRMHPSNVKALEIARIDHCSLANNHVIDWGRPGLQETLTVLQESGISYSGAGENLSLASAPSVFKRKGVRILVFSFGFYNSGIPPDWAAKKERSGVNYLSSMSAESFQTIKVNIEKKKSPGDIVILSVHWGGNWGYDISDRWRAFAHELIDDAQVDLIFGHSSHHPMGMEVYKGKLILYGTGDFINDYEGIRGHAEYRSELTLMYFPELSLSGDLVSLKMVPVKIKNFQLNKVKPRDITWLRNVLSKEGQALGTKLKAYNDRMLQLEWDRE